MSGECIGLMDVGGIDGLLLAVIADIKRRLGGKHEASRLPQYTSIHASLHSVAI